MGSFVLYGPVTLRGKVEISGAKNAALPILASIPLIKGTTVLHNVPRLEDVHTMIQILRSIGVKVEWKGENTLLVINEGRCTGDVPYELVRKMRASFNILGPLTLSVGKASVAQPGGCAIGLRPVNFHIDGLEKLGFSVSISHGTVHATAPGHVDEGEVVVSFPRVSVGATEHIMTTAAGMKGLTLQINNAAQEPEIEDLQNFLNGCGARITGAGTSSLTVEGVEELQGCEYTIMYDRIEAGTYLIAAAATHGEVEVVNACSNHLGALLEVFEYMGVNFTCNENGITVKAGDVYKPVKIEVNPYPGFPTDLQPQILAMLSTVKGVSLVKENVFKSRFGHVPELNRMGASIVVEDSVAVVEGVEELTGAPVEATDLRAAAALLIAALMAKGETIISHIEHIFRGYEKVIEKFRGLGVNIVYEPRDVE